MKKLKAISRWITIQCKEVTKKSALYGYGGDDLENGKRYVLFFRWHNKEFAFDRFLARFGIVGFDPDCKEYPAFITGYDGDNYYNPILCSITEYGDKIRLFEEL